ncbi:MAG TPA: hypothetical protein VFG07_08955 [Thermoplasmata archaeon]|nr:hypothetical protein [Thermoplasmata archaeon]
MLIFREPAKLAEAFTVDFMIDWTDESGVHWGGTWIGLRPKVAKWLVNDGYAQETPFVVTMRQSPQALPLPEIGQLTRTLLRQDREGQNLFRAYEEGRDSLIAGLPNASVAVIAKAAEAAIFLRGVRKGWPVSDWAARKRTLGELLAERVVAEDIQSSVSLGFYKSLHGTNAQRIMAVHSGSFDLTIIQATAVLEDVTRLIDAWFGEQ